MIKRYSLVLQDILSLIDDNTILNIYSATTLELLASYDGVLNTSIPKRYYNSEVRKITSENTTGVAVYIGFSKIKLG